MTDLTDQALTAEQANYLQCALQVIRKVAGPLDDLDTLTLTHTNGKKILRPNAPQVEPPS